MPAPTPPGAPSDGPIRALLWDVDGTLAETELDGHRRAFNRAFADEGLPWRWDGDTYLQLLRVSGGRERLRAFLTEREGSSPEAERIERLQTRKQVHYGELVRSGAVALRPGVARLIREAAEAGLTQAIVTTSGRTAVEALTQGGGAAVREAFAFWVCGDDVTRKKPDPEGYRTAIHRLGMAPREVLAIEDSHNGLAAATAAGLGCLVTLSRSSRWEGGADGTAGFEAALAVLDGLGERDDPLHCHRGPACPGGRVTLAWLQGLAAGR